MYISTCILNKILSPTLLWVWKFDLKLGCWPLIFKITISTLFFKNRAKSKAFRNTDGHRPFFENFMKIWKFQKFDSPLGKGRRSRPNECVRSVHQAAIISLRGPKKIYTASSEAASLRMGWDGWMGWMGRKIKSVLQFSSYFVGIQFMYRCTYIHVQSLSPTLLWVWKFDLKLGCWPLIFKITISTWFF